MTPDTCSLCGHPTTVHFRGGRKLTCDKVCRQFGTIVRDASGSTRAGATPEGGATAKSSAPGSGFSRRGKLLTTREGAAYLGISAIRLRRLVGQGEVAVMRNKHGRLAGVYVADLEAWVEKRRQPAAGDRPWRPVDEAMRRLIRDAS
jgi:excisionase family DNA binding protein